LPGGLHGDAGRAGQRPREGARPDRARQAQARLRPLHPGARGERAADQGGLRESAGPLVTPAVLPGARAFGRALITTTAATAAAVDLQQAWVYKSIRRGSP